MFRVENENGRIYMRGSYEECVNYLAEHWQFVLFFRVVREEDGAIWA